MKKTLVDTQAKKVSFLDTNFYQLDDKFYPGVTTVLSHYPKGYGYQQWLMDLGNTSKEVLERAAEQGSNVHNAIERFLNGETVRWQNEEGEAKYTAKEWRMIMRFLDFFKRYDPQIIAVEAQVVDEDLGVGGTLDFVCKINDKVFLIDWKTSNSVYKTHHIQTSVYREMWNRQSKVQIEESGVFHLRARTRTDKDIQGKGWKLYLDKKPEHNFKLFSHTKALWDEENKNYKPLNEVYPSEISIENIKK